MDVILTLYDDSHPGNRNQYDVTLSSEEEYRLRQIEKYARSTDDLLNELRDMDKQRYDSVFLNIAEEAEHMEAPVLEIGNA